LIPEYQLVNKGMGLEAFKTLYWWEWGHRLLGRLIGAVFLLPFVYFLVRGMIPRPFVSRIAALFLLGGAQGALGWFMVKSGLVERVDVSQYRLAAHLALAIAIAAFAFWLALSIRPAPRSRPRDEDADPHTSIVMAAPAVAIQRKKHDKLGEGWMAGSSPAMTREGRAIMAEGAIRCPRGAARGKDGRQTSAREQRTRQFGESVSLTLGAAILAGLVYLQIVIGGFVAGLKAGHASNTWPLMNGEIIPAGLDVYSPWWLNAFENPIAAQFVHRMVAYAVALFAAAMVPWIWRSQSPSPSAAAGLKAPALTVLAVVLLQIALGVATVVFEVPIGVALAHQANAVLVLGASLWMLRRATAPAH
jgi:heme a synthase